MSLGSIVISWTSRKQFVPTNSTTEENYMAIVESNKEIIWAHMHIERFTTKPGECYSTYGP